MLKLNLGCGNQAIPGWVNVDDSIGARLSKFPFFTQINKRIKLLHLTWDHSIYIHDLTKPFPWKEQSVDIIYTSHTLEHFVKNDGRFFLSECHRVLKTDGILRVIVPDFRVLVERYLSGAVKAEDFAIIQVINYHAETDGFFRKKLAPFIRSPHKCMYDVSLLEIIQGLGFDAALKLPFESDIPAVHEIEREERTKDVVIVEGRKICVA